TRFGKTSVPPAVPSRLDGQNGNGAVSPADRASPRRRPSGFFRGCLDGNLLGLHLGSLLDVDRQDAVLEVGVNRVRVDPLREGERASEIPVGALVHVEGFRLLLLVRFSLSGRGQAVACERHMQIRFLDTWNVSLEGVSIARLLDFERRNKVGRES